MANTYTLVILMSVVVIPFEIKADNSLQAAKKAYKNLAKHF